jgi:hypothetical protein
VTVTFTSSCGNGSIEAGRSCLVSASGRAWPLAPRPPRAAPTLLGDVL